MNVKEFSKIFQMLRKEHGYTQDEISKILGVSKSSIAMWETSQRLPSPELYEQIADYFNVDIDYLYGRSTVRQRIRFDEDGNMQRTLTQDESDLLDDFQKLNAEGKSEARKQVRNLTKIEDYTKDTGSSASAAG